MFDACRAFARMVNTRDYSHLEPWLSETVAYSSQRDAEEVRGKSAYSDCMTAKLSTINARREPVWAELGYVNANSTCPCILLGEGDEQNLTSTVLIELTDGKIAHITEQVASLPGGSHRTHERPYFFYQDKTSAIQQALRWMDLDKRCGGYAGHCLKCDGALQYKYDTIAPTPHTRGGSRH